MFTGIINNTYPVVWLERRTGLMSFAVELNAELTVGLVLGASVAIDGVCLTVSKITGQQIFFDVIEETLRVTTLGSLVVGSMVNVERSLKFGDELGGHLLSGHIDTTVKIVAIDRAENKLLLTLAARDSKWLEYIMPKGYVGLHGASLTVINPDSTQGTFQVSLIPETNRSLNLALFLIYYYQNFFLTFQHKGYVQLQNLISFAEY